MNDKQIQLQFGRINEEMRRLRERISSVTGASGEYVTPTSVDGQIIAGDGLTGGGSLPGTITLDVGAGDGVDVAANSVAVDVTDIIDTAAGLTESTNDIQVNLGTGLTFSTGAVVLSWSGTPEVIQPDDSAASGSSSYAARIDHVHGIVAAVPGAIQPDDSAVEGIAVSFARSDHQHSIVAAAAGVIQPDDSAAEGSSTSFARSDHAHGIVAAAPDADSVDVAASSEGTSTSFARADHTHNLDESIAPTWTAEHTFQADIQLDADLDFIGAQSITTDSGNLTIAPAGDVLFDPTGNDILPVTNYDLNIGALSKKYLTLHAAELWVETLVAQDTIATIGGRILVGPTTKLTTDLSSSTINGTNELSNGDFETAGGGGADVFANWIETAGDGSIEQDSSIYHWNSNSCKLTSGDSSNTEIYQDATVVAGEDKQLVFWTRGDGTLAGFYRIYDVSNTTDILAKTTTGVTDATWTRVIYRYTVPVGCSSVRMYYYCPTRSTNEMANPGFETAGGGGADVFSDWLEDASDGAIAQDSATKHGGTYSAKLTAGVSVDTYVRQLETVVAGESKELSFWTRGDGTYDGRYKVYDVTNGANIIAMTSTGVTGTTWTEVIDNYIVPAGCTSIAVYFYCPATNTGIGWFDDVDHFGGHVHFDDVNHHDQMTIEVEHNQMVVGDVAYMEADGKVEFFDITSGPSGVGPYSYYVWRDRDWSGANDWYAGDALFNTGNVGDGFIDVYSVQGVSAGSTAGPTIVGNIRNDATFNDWTEHWAIGNLNGVYGYGVDTYGVGLGKYSEADYLTIDPTNGIRFFDADDTVLAQLTGSTWTIGEVAASKPNIQITADTLRFRTNLTPHGALNSVGTFWFGDSGSTERIQWDTTNGLQIFNASNAAVLKAPTSGDVDIIGTLDVTSPGKITAGTGVVTLDADGVGIEATSSYLDLRSYRFDDSSGNMIAKHDTYYTGSYVYTRIYAHGVSGGPSESQVALWATNTAHTGTSYFRLKSWGASELNVMSELSITSQVGGALLKTTGDIRALGGLYVGSDVDPDSDDIHYDGNLKSMKNSTYYDVYAFVPLDAPLTATDFNGDSFSTTAKTLIDLQKATGSGGHGAPANIKAVLVSLTIRDSGAASTDCYLILSPNNTASQGIAFSCLPANDRWSRCTGVIPCDSNGDIYYQIAASGSSTFDVYLSIWGYFI